MGRQFAWDDIPDSGALLPAGTYLVGVESIEEKTAEQSGKLMYSAVFRVIEPDQFSNMPIYNNFVIGNDDDPGADDPETQKASVGAKMMKACMKAAQVAFHPDIDVMIGAAQDQQLVITLTQSTETKEGPYKGRVRNNVAGFYPVGTREPSVTAGGAPAVKPAKPPLKGVTGGKAQAPARPGAPIGGKLPPKAAAPVSAKAPVGKKTAAAATVTCTLCDPAQQVPRTEYVAHVQAHDEE